ncbi:MAG TPA: hypothetical protein VHU15_06745 [Stellaceae bacterium]|jgi:hypothetical protein|nr:hypothetical protein [Stellaceae bacterium]
MQNQAGWLTTAVSLAKARAYGGGEFAMAGLVFLYTTIAFGSALIYFAYH